MAAGWRRATEGSGVSFLKKIVGKVRGFFAKVFRLVVFAGGLVALIVVLDALLSPDGPGGERG